MRRSILQIKTVNKKRGGRDQGNRVNLSRAEEGRDGAVLKRKIDLCHCAEEADIVRVCEGPA